MTDLENYMLVEMLSKDFSNELFPEESKTLDRLSVKLSDNLTVVSSFSIRKMIGAALLTLIGILNYILLYNSGPVVIITYIPYRQVAGLPAIFVGSLFIVYQIFSAREFYILNYENRYFFGEKTSLGSFQRLQFFSFKKKDVKQMILGNCPINYEISIFFVCWWLIWFYFREGIISLRNYNYLGYPNLLRVGTLLILTAVIFAGVFISWTVPVGRSQLKVVLEGSYVEFNFNELFLDDAEKIQRILHLPEIPNYGETVPREVTRKTFIKSDEDEPVGVLNYNLLWKYFYILFGALLAISGFILVFIDLYVNFSLGMFLEVFIGFLGLKFIIYGTSEHFFQKHYEKDTRKLEKYESEVMCFQENALYGFRVGFSELIEDELDDRSKKVTKTEREQSTPDLIYPFERRQKSNFKPVSIFNLVIMGITYYYLIYQSFKIFSPNRFYAQYLFFPLWAYWFIAGLIIVPTVLVFIKSDLPSWKGNSKDIMAIIRNSKNKVNRELMIRLIIMAGLIFFPIALTISGVPFML